MCAIWLDGNHNRRTPHQWAWSCHGTCTPCHPGWHHDNPPALSPPSSGAWHPDASPPVSPCLPWARSLVEYYAAAAWTAARPAPRLPGRRTSTAARGTSPTGSAWIGRPPGRASRCASEPLVVGCGNGWSARWGGAGNGCGQNGRVSDRWVAGSGGAGARRSGHAVRWAACA